MSIKAFLILCFALINLAGYTIPQVYHYSDNPKIVSVFPFDKTNTIRLKTDIAWNDIQISGIIIAKHNGDTVIGAFINEFGVKAFEFQVCYGKCVLNKLLPYFDKWYIRKAFKKDIAFIFTIPPQLRSEGTNKCFDVDRRTKYIYSFYDENLVKVTRIEKNKEVAVMKHESDSLYTMQAYKRNILYRFTLISNYE